MDFRRGTLIRPKKLWNLILGTLSVVFCDVFVWGGGNLIRDRKYWLNIYIKPLLLAQALGKRVIIWSIGVDKINNKEVIRLANKITNVSLVSFRDEASKDNFLQISRHFDEKAIMVIRDPVFHYSSTRKSESAGNSKSVGFNVTFWKADLSDNNRVEKFASTFAGILENIHRKTGVKLVYLPSAPYRDEGMYKILSKYLGPEFTIDYPQINDPAEYVAHLSQLDLLVGMRMHSIIMASNVVGLIVFGIIYDEKVQALSEEAKMGSNFFSIDNVIESPQEIEKKILEALKSKHMIDFSALRADSERMIEIVRPIINHTRSI